MNHFSSLLAGLIILMITGCSGPETLVVESDAITPADVAYDNSLDDDSDEGFQYLHVGEASPIYSLDPLFATNNSEWRIIDLIYDNLVTYNVDGEIVPELARKWEMTNDSLRYTFTLRNDVFYHNTEAFVSGIGRKVSALDVRRIIERMAYSNVPDQAAALFSSIRGFNTYRAEQNDVKDPSKRVVAQIDGLRVTSDSTIQILLNQPDKDFLKKLAHPIASVYPLESTYSSSGPIDELATGSGRFYLVQKQDNKYILGANLDYYKERPEISRLDMTYGFSERDLFDRFQNGELDALIEVSPAILKTIADSSAQLKPDYAQDAQLQNTGVYAEYALYMSSENRTKGTVYQLAKRVQSTGNIISDSYLGSIEVLLPDSSAYQTDISQLVVTQTDNPFESFLVNTLAGIATQQQMSFSMKASFALTENTTFSTNPGLKLQKVFSWKMPVFILSKPEVEGLGLNVRPWILKTGSITPEEEM